MTREQLDAIRARVDEAANRNWSMEAKVLVDARALLAEVERLTAELHRMKSRPVEAEFSRLDTMWQQLVRERDEAVHELSRLKGVRSEVNTAKLNDAFTEGTLKAGEAMRPLVAAAFARGVAAMREAAAQSLSFHSYADEIIRALPDPEDTYNQKETK
jgi:hypothetical protein